LFRRVAAALPGMDQQQKREDSILVCCYLTLPYRAGDLIPSAEDSSEPSVHSPY